VKATVVSKSSGERRWIPTFALTGSIAPDLDEDGNRVFSLGPYSYCRLELSGILSETVLGVATHEGTLELQVSESGPVELLLPPGQYSAYLDQLSAKRTIRIEPERDDNGTFELSR
jgi:hypothetical protein